MVCMASFLSSNGLISSHFHNNHLNCQHMPILWCSLIPFGHDMKILKKNFMTSSLMNCIEIKLS